LELGGGEAVAMAGGRRLFVDVVGAKGLMPKDGQGSANAYCVVREILASGIEFLVVVEFRVIGREANTFMVQEGL